MEDLLTAGVSVPSDEEFLKSDEGKKKTGMTGSKSKDELRKVLTTKKLVDARKEAKRCREVKCKTRKELEQLVSERRYKNQVSKVKKHCCLIQSQIKKEHHSRVEWLKWKYKREKPFSLPDELQSFSKCKIFSEGVELAATEIDGVSIVEMEGESIILTPNERALLRRGPKFCVLKNCKEETALNQLEVCITKHKWQCMADGEEKVTSSPGLEDPPPPTEEEMREATRLKELSEELSAEARTAFDDKNRIFDLNKIRVTDYKKNSRVILPRAQTPEQESKLEVVRVELMEQHNKRVRENCNCRAEQPMNLSDPEKDGLKTIRIRMRNGEIVIIPTDKSGRFAVMLMNTYICAGEGGWPR